MPWACHALHAPRRLLQLSLPQHSLVLRAHIHFHFKCLQEVKRRVSTPSVCTFGSLPPPSSALHVQEGPILHARTHARLAAVKSSTCLCSTHSHCTVRGAVRIAQRPSAESDGLRGLDVDTAWTTETTQQPSKVTTARLKKISQTLSTIAYVLHCHDSQAQQKGVLCTHLFCSQVLHLLLQVRLHACKPLRQPLHPCAFAILEPVALQYSTPHTADAMLALCCLLCSKHDV